MKGLFISSFYVLVHTAVSFIICLSILVPSYYLLKFPSFIMRKMLHAMAFIIEAVIISFSREWMPVALASAVISILVYPILHFAERFSWYDRLLVQKHKGEVIRSMFMYFLLFAFIVLFCWGIFGRKDIAIVSVIIWGIGDASAALIGIPFGRHKVITPFTDGKKSYEGSIAMFISSSIVAAISMMELGMFERSKTVPAAVTAAFAATLCELFTPGEYDTLTVPLIVMAILLIMT